jgi:hypothetical protein
LNTVTPKRPFSFATVIDNTIWVFCILWVIAFILYLPASQAGMVGDFPAWLDKISHSSRSEYLNWNISGVKILYQFTQAVTYVICRIFGINRWAWHIIQLSMHVGCCALLYQILKQLCTDLKIKYAANIGLGVALLFCVTPYASEAVVYEPCFHFSMALGMSLFILLWVQNYLHSARPVYIWLAAITFLCATYSLEVFYITPFFTLTLILFYYFTNNIEKPLFKRSLRFFILPQVAFLLLHFVVFLKVYGKKPPHSLYLQKDLWYLYIANPAKYLFHILGLGRYYDDESKKAVYNFCENTTFSAVFYGLFFLITIIFVARFRKMKARGKLLSLVFAWSAIALAFVMPLWFYDKFYILFDRYVYVPAAIIYALLVVLISYIPNKYIATLLFSAFLVVNISYTVKTNSYWQRSAAITDTLLNNFPEVGDKIVLLLNPPQCYNGALMIRAVGESEFKTMHNLLLPKKINNKVYDVASFNMLTPQDGVHIMVVYDSVCHVSLNDFGNFWWYDDKGAKSYENADYKVNMIDVGHWYELTLKHPASQYILLYVVDDQWRIVDWNYKNLDQY